MPTAPWAKLKDARRGVGDDQPGGGDGVDRPGTMPMTVYWRNFAHLRSPKPCHDAFSDPLLSAPRETSLPGLFKNLGQPADALA